MPIYPSSERSLPLFASLPKQTKTFKISRRNLSCSLSKFFLSPCIAFPTAYFSSERGDPWCPHYCCREMAPLTTSAPVRPPTTWPGLFSLHRKQPKAFEVKLPSLRRPKVAAQYVSPVWIIGLYPGWNGMSRYLRANPAAQGDRTVKL
jgi:hypothetical protein